MKLFHCTNIQIYILDVEGIRCKQKTGKTFLLLNKI